MPLTTSFLRPVLSRSVVITPSIRALPYDVLVSVETTVFARFTRTRVYAQPAWIFLDRAFFSPDLGCYPGQAGKQEGGHLRPNEKAAGNRARQASEKAKNGSHLRFIQDRHLRPQTPIRQVDDGWLSGTNTAKRENIRFRKSLYVNEEASYREASFVDCDGQFTSTSRTLSTAIVSPKTICPGRPQATNGVETSLAILRPAVNPSIARRPSKGIALGAAARLHRMTASLQPFGMLPAKRAVDRRRAQVLSRAYSANPCEASAAASTPANG